MATSARDRRLAAIDQGLRELREFLQHPFAEALGLQLAPVPEIFLGVVGLVGDVPIRMHVHRFQGAGFASFTVVACEANAGPMVSLAAIGLPKRGMGLPVVGVDMIGARRTLALVALDLPPTDQTLDAAIFAPLLAALHERLAPFTRPRSRRDAPSTESTRLQPAVIAASRKGHEPSVFAAVRVFFEEFAQATQRHAADFRLAGSRADAAVFRVQQWREQELRYRATHTGLSAIFGNAFTQRLLHELLLAPIS